MAFTRPHSTAADATFSAAGAAAWNANQTPTGADVGGIPYCPTATTETTSANLTYTEASGPRLKIGASNGANQGFIIGNANFSGYGGIWSTSVTPSTSNFCLLDAGGVTQIGSAAQGRVEIAPASGSAKFTVYGTAGQGAVITAGTATTDVQALSATQTWNAAGVTFTGWKFTITDTASAAGSLAMQILGGASGTTSLLALNKNGQLALAYAGAVTTPTLNIGGTQGNGFYSTGDNIFGASGGVQLFSATNAAINWWGNDNGKYSFFGNGNPVFFGSAGTRLAAITSSGANSLNFGGDNSGEINTATLRTEINKAVTAFTDGVAKTVFTLTIPNAAHSASYLVRLTGSIGAGGAIGANEASATNAYIVTICRTAGVNAVAGISAAFGASTSAVAGATTVTCTAALAAVSGAVGATNTIDIQATITKGGGASDNHTCVATASLLNANATGITIA